MVTLTRPHSDYFFQRNHTPSETTSLIIKLLEEHRQQFKHVYRMDTNIYATSNTAYVKAQWSPEFRFELSTKKPSSRYEWQSKTTKSAPEALQLLTDFFQKDSR